MSQSSSLASIVSTQTWKTDDKTPLALFHKKFWSKSMKDEESEWHNNQPGVVYQDGDGRLDQDQDQDQDETMDMDGNII
jgi:hypothetical protein